MRVRHSSVEEDLHAKRVLSLAHATLDVVHTAPLSVHAIGQALEWARGGVQKHGIKQGEYPGPGAVDAAGESLGMEKGLKANTVKTRTYSLFRKGCMYYQAIPMMKEERLRPLVERSAELLHQHPLFKEALYFI